MFVFGAESPPKSSLIKPFILLFNEKTKYRRKHVGSQRDDSKMGIQFYNTSTRKKEVFKPIRKREVRIYCCGPTVYLYAHIGNFKTYIFEDILRRVLEFNGFKVKHAMNITDVGHLTSDADTGEDRMEVGARREKKVGCCR